MKRESQTLQITYDDSLLRKLSEMSTRDLAPALLATSDLIEQANFLVGETGSEVKVNVKGNFKKGSFEIDLIVHQGLSSLLKFFEHIPGDQQLGLDFQQKLDE